MKEKPALLQTYLPGSMDRQIKDHSKLEWKAYCYFFWKEQSWLFSIQKYWPFICNNNWCFYSTEL